VFVFDQQNDLVEIPNAKLGSRGLRVPWIVNTRTGDTIIARRGVRRARLAAVGLFFLGFASS
jgi:hypothetical protein